MKLVVGLGNPGKEYIGTRHNLGWEVVSAFAEVCAAKFEDKSRFHARIAEINRTGEKALLILPQTYMNLSGEALQAVTSFYKVSLSDILVVHDEMDYPVGQLAFCAQAGPAGHNGIRSIQERLGTDRVARLRLGIDRPRGRLPVEDYVLQPFSSEETKSIETVITQAVQAIHEWLDVGTDKVMNIWNRKRPT